MAKLTVREKVAYTKPCTRCKEIKHLSSFYIRGDKKGMMSACKGCHKLGISPASTKKQYNKEYFERNKEKIYAARKLRSLYSLPNKASRVYQNSKTKAKEKGWGFNLSKEFLILLYHKQEGLCALSGETLTISGDRRVSEMMSLDRIDSSLGYTIDNVQWVCVKYNFMKNEHELDTFIELCKRIVEYHHE